MATTSFLRQATLAKAQGVEHQMERAHQEHRERVLPHGELLDYTYEIRIHILNSSKAPNLTTVSSLVGAVLALSKRQFP